MVKTNLPVLFLRGIVVLPNNELRIEINTELEKKIIDASLEVHDGHLLLIALRDYLEESPSLLDLPKIGVLGHIKSKIELSNGTLRLVIVGLTRTEVLFYLEGERGFAEAFVIPCKDYDVDPFEESAIRRVLLRDLNTFIETSSAMSNSILGKISDLKSLDVICDMIINELPLSYENKLKYLEVVNPLNRSRLVIEDINRELETVKLENKIDSELRKELDTSQKEFVLKEKIKIIKKELGESDSKEEDVSLLKMKVDELIVSSKIKTRLINEINRYEMTPPTSPEVSIIRNYIEWLLNIPWNNVTIDNDNLEEVADMLNESHYGLDKVKSRILEYIAASKYSNNKISPIICLVGPPGTGKTSLAKSIASSLHRKFVKISVGGVNDEAEIMGHRRTYVASNPGKIIQGLKKSGTKNPVFLIDEIDKMTKDYRGDPASALLDVLDKEQNYMFIDNYIEEEVDLSEVMFILTANNASDIPLALRDRLEIIELSSYTVYEKIDIAKNYLFPKLLKIYNLDSSKISISDDVYFKIISSYTKEAGARELERLLASIIRKVIVKLLSKKPLKKYNITVSNLSSYLGMEKYIDSYNGLDDAIGLVNAVAFTNYGGAVLKVSSTYYKGKGELIVTGSIGEVMKESVILSLSYIKTNYELFNIDSNILDNMDIHIHFEEGALPKDGPSAGITVVTSLISLFKGVTVPTDISMTGEITLRGKVLPIGGLKEKIIAATTHNIKKIYIPYLNAYELDNIPSYIKEKIEIVLVKDYLEIYEDLFK